MTPTSDSVIEFTNLAIEHYAHRDKIGAFYGGGSGIGVGAGLICDDVRVPLYNPSTREFLTGAGPVLVLTHECDVDPANNKSMFNNRVLVAPILPFNIFCEEWLNRSDKNSLHQATKGLAADSISRAFLLPPAGTGTLEFGGIIYLNNLCGTGIGEFGVDDCELRLALSTFAMSLIDRKLGHHLFREKADQLPRLS